MPGVGIDLDYSIWGAFVNKESSCCQNRLAGEQKGMVGAWDFAPRLFFDPLDLFARQLAPESNLPG